MSTEHSAVRYDRDADGIVTLTLDDPQASANTMNERYAAAMHDAVERLHAEKDDLVGVVVTSAKRTFFAGGDLKGMLQTGPDDAEAVFHQVESVKRDLRRLETLGRPVVAAINGAALGGGLEIALACHHRVAAEGRYEIGLPEATLGLLPGGGGVTRTVRMFGIQTALMDVLLQGPRMKPAQAQEKGLVDEVVPAEELLDRARAWVREHADDAEAATQPWDRDGYRMPGGTPSSPKLAQFLPAFPAMLRKQLRGADYPAQRAIMSAAIEGAQVDVETASRIESRYLAGLITGSNSKNMIQAFFLDLQAINGGSLRPEGVPAYTARKVGVLGAGMMGAGIAYVCAKAGMEVVLKDVSDEAAARGKAYSEKILAKAVERGRSTQEQADEVLARITPATQPDALAGADLLIEAVFEDPSLKAKVYAEVLPVLAPDALLCSNTSTLPITGLAEHVDRPADFVGLHFFSPVDKMPLVEIIRGEQTSDEAVAKALDVVQQIRKTPIVVNDSRGFYTSRVIGTMVNEGLAMLAEGVHPMSVERAALQAGYPVGTLQLSDELNLELMAKIAKATADAAGPSYVEHPGTAVVQRMLGAGRPGKLRGAGFYDYADGRRGSLWPGLAELFPSREEPADLDDLKDRYLFIEALETARCFEEGVIESAAAANIGSIMGIGYPPPTGGTVQFMQGYDGPTGRGLPGFVERADQLTKLYGDRFAPTPRLREMAERGERFPA
ncbi:3-hydroxyacyl-CoA dehydrogenase NAD-binding domain-containing protein [Nocardioides aequoreus]|uniref:3-hydroxyacyl-CoA dehydrogenase NAD-binding domain-containing protein n=1 Tax=Nocardioides aequoreus TaxID=397278 RepID=UPI0004C46670|nr:3-hydroxyacyl-CoA dehydrogenase NAD-binding domain-containing protein [Nocardioides aequoreus]